jgi:hypothetical protein
MVPPADKCFTQPFPLTLINPKASVSIDRNIQEELESKTEKDI